MTPRNIILLLILLGTVFGIYLYAQRSDQTQSQPVEATASPDQTQPQPAEATPSPDQAIHTSAASFVGSATCQQCHADQFQAWAGSDHHLAFAEANSQSVQGNFDDVAVDYIDGKAVFSQKESDQYLITLTTDQGQHSYPVQYTLGHYPLQQYILETEPGRYQVFALAWDTRNEDQGGQRWMELQPNESAEDDNPFHWTGYFQNWNSQCADCHTTNYEKGLQAATGEHPFSYNSHWSEAGVGCEACHGPASEHIAWAAEPNPNTDNGLLSSISPSTAWQFQPGEAIASPVGNATVGDVSPSTENGYLRTCARCHSLRHPIGDKPFEQVPAQGGHSTFSDHFYPQLVSEPLYFPDGQIREEVFVYGSFLQSKMHNAGVTCGDCHDAHSGEVLQFDATNIANPSNDAVCAQCHLPNVYAVEEHHQHPPESEAARCVSCHMPATTYMMVDPRRDHSFSVPSPALSAVSDTPNACTDCHTGQDDNWAAAQIAGWHGDNETATTDFAHWQLAAAQLPPNASQRQWQQIEEQRHELLSSASTPEMEKAMLLQTMPVVDNPSYQALVASLSDEDVVVRLAAIERLTGVDPATRAQLLTPLLDDKDHSVRLRATLELADLLLEPQYPERQRLQQRVDEYIKIYQRHEDLLASQSRLAALYQRTGNYNQAADAYQKALELVPGVISTMLNLADTYRALNRDDDAEELLLQAVAAAEKEAARSDQQYREAAIAQQASAHYALGLLYVRSKEYTRALERFQSAVELQPFNDQYFYAYLLDLDALERRDEALELLQNSPLTRQSQRLQELQSAWIDR